MINGITQNGRYVMVSGGNSSQPYISPGAVGAGMMRYNPNMNCIEISDGNSWQRMSMDYASVGLTPEAESLLDWAKAKMTEEKRLNELCKKYPGLDRARSNFETFKQLVLAEESIEQTVQSSP